MNLCKGKESSGIIVITEKYSFLYNMISSFRKSSLFNDEMDGVSYIILKK